MVTDGINVTGASVENIPPRGSEVKKVDVESKPAPKKRDFKPVIEQIKKVDKELFEKAVEELNQNIKIFNTKLSFSIDDKTGKTIIRISERDTNKVIREIPPEALLRVASKLNEIIGMLFDLKI
ncbi:hypothetical protein DRQ09_07495 [candidate division KSB1 bacterium]|mgnify:CR=1 FL=1|nr:MAG: hypothetical protein DRQ09_07495 [candidate division KSB1 bacterium]